MDSATNPDPTDLSALTVALGSAGLGGPDPVAAAETVLALLDAAGWWLVPSLGVRRADLASPIRNATPEEIEAAIARHRSGTDLPLSLLDVAMTREEIDAYEGGAQGWLDANEIPGEHVVLCLQGGEQIAVVRCAPSEPT